MWAKSLWDDVVRHSDSRSVALTGMMRNCHSERGGRLAVPPMTRWHFPTISFSVAPWVWRLLIDPITWGLTQMSLGLLSTSSQESHRGHVKPHENHQGPLTNQIAEMRITSQSDGAVPTAEKINESHFRVMMLLLLVFTFCCWNRNCLNYNLMSNCNWSFQHFKKNTLLCIRKFGFVLVNHNGYSNLLYFLLWGTDKLSEFNMCSVWSFLYIVGIMLLKSVILHDLWLESSRGHC